MAASGYNRPQQRRTTRRVIAALLVVLSIIIVLADKQRQASLTDGRLSIDDPSAKVLGFIAAPARGISAMFSDVEARSNAFEENKTLKQQIVKLRAQNADLLEKTSRLKQFENMLAVKQLSDQPMRRIAARAVDEQNGPFVHSALINSGTENGVQTGYAVMTPDGYYGYVVRAGKTSARVLLANDLSSRISVKSARSETRAIMVGANTMKPDLRYIAEQADWLAADLVVSSGDDGILPAGLPIGTVENNAKGELKVKLFSLQSPVDWVFVTEFIPTPPPDTSDNAEKPIEDLP